jgi:hypothetical protein
VAGKREQFSNAKNDVSFPLKLNMSNPKEKLPYINNILCGIKISFLFLFSSQSSSNQINKKKRETFPIILIFENK